MYEEKSTVKIKGRAEAEHHQARQRWLLVKRLTLILAASRAVAVPRIIMCGCSYMWIRLIWAIVSTGRLLEFLVASK